MAIKKRGGLGSGMSSLFSSNEIEEKHSGGVLEVDINKITPNTLLFAFIFIYLI